jgi:hypothetical protein
MSARRWPRCASAALRAGRQLALHRFEQRRHRRFGIARQRNVGCGVALHFTVVRAHHQILGADVQDLQLGLTVQPHIRPSDQIAHFAREAPQIMRLKREYHIRLRERLLAAARVIELVAAREIHPEAAVDDRRVQQFRQLHEQRGRLVGAAVAVGVDHRILGGDQ